MTLIDVSRQQVHQIDITAADLFGVNSIAISIIFFILSKHRALVRLATVKVESHVASCY